MSMSREEKNAKRREYYKKNADKIKAEAMKRYDERDRGKYNAKKREYYRSNPDRQREAHKRWLANGGSINAVSSKMKVRAHRLKHKYKMTQEEWDVLFTSQGNACAICKAEEPGTKYHWHTDHCHDTNKVRGILCHRCNSFLLRHGTTSEILRAAADYLER